MEEIIKLLNSIESRLDRIEKIIEINQLSAKKMNDHIDFIDDIYDNIKKPFCKVLTYYNGKTVNIDKNLLKSEE